MSGDPREVRFALLVSSKAAFDWLVQRHGFTLVSWLSQFVEYRSRGVALSVELVPAKEPHLSILQSQLEDLHGPAGTWSRHSQADIAKHLHPHLADNELRRRLPVRTFPARDPAAIEAAVGALALRWQAYLEQIDLQDEQLWNSLRIAKLNRLLTLADDDAAGRATKAFDAGDYRQALALYAQAPGPLTASDRRRLAIARQRAGLAGRPDGP